MLTSQRETSELSKQQILGSGSNINACTGQPVKAVSPSTAAIDNNIKYLKGRFGAPFCYAQIIN